MISPFLKFLAALVRRLVAENRAIHVTEADAGELEMLAGLTWVDAPLVARALREVVAEARGVPIEQVAVRAPLAPADIAHAWLRLSRAPMRNQDGADGSWYRVADEDEVKRAAVCAELAVLAAVIFVERPEPSDRIGAPSMPQSGTREGARAAWSTILDWLAANRDGIQLWNAPAEEKAPTIARITALIDRYRRELEAMA